MYTGSCRTIWAPRKGGHMARMDQMPRARRRRVASGFGIMVALIGGAFLTAGARNDLNWVVILIAVGITASGIALIRWGNGGYAAAVQADQGKLAQAGQWDGLPAGAHQKGDRIGLRTLTIVTWMFATLGVIFLLLGALLALGSEGEQDMLIGGVGVMFLGLVMFAALTMLAGTAYWLDAQGVHRTRWPSGEVDWVDVKAIDEHQQVVILRTEGQARRAFGRKSKTFQISAGALEIHQQELVRLLSTLRAHATSTPEAG